ncbi:MFS transporter [Rhizobium rhizosphaerae]|uniref:MFS transporter n=1 Tax=Xaviernesmea rhizosphaerae TaxID=1672749 RepID=A0A1Q9APA9_9HYPH|nr:DMT family transporter [Xaviernesmea rhizosphaerae]OLP57279.1 MFS transporter [Xaviernesmea rhizosphaerae]
MTRLNANLCLLLAGAIWGAGFVAQSTAMAAIGPLWFIGLRFVLASLVAAPLAWREARQAAAPVSRRDWLGFLATGLALFTAAVTQQIGLLTTTVTNSGFLTSLYVVFTPLLSLLVLRRAPHRLIWPAAALAFVGIFLLSGGSLTAFRPGDAWTLLCALFWAMQVLLVGAFAARSGRPMALSLAQFLVCAVASLIAAAAFEPISMAAITGAGMEILYAGIFSSGIAFILQVVGQRFTTAPQAAIFLSSEALFAALFGALLLGESIPAAGYLGCAAIFAGILLAELGPYWGRRKLTS